MRRNRDDRPLHRSAQELFSVLLQLLEDHRGDLLGGESGLDLGAGGHVELDERLVLYRRHHLACEVLEVRLHCRLRKVAADEPLGIVDGIRRVARGLVLGGVANEARAVLGRVCHPRRRRAPAVGVGNNLHTTSARAADGDA